MALTGLGKVLWPRETVYVLKAATMLSGMKIIWDNIFLTLIRKTWDLDYEELKKQEDRNLLEKVQSLLFLGIKRASRNQNRHWYQLWTIQVNHPWDESHERGSQNLHWSRKLLRRKLEVLNNTGRHKEEFLVQY